MRFFLMIAGLLGMGFGVFFMAYAPPGGHAHASPILISGAVFFAIGSSTVDIVEAIKNRRE